MEQNQLPTMNSRLSAYFVDSFLYSILFFGILCGVRELYLSSAAFSVLLSNPEITGLEEMVLGKISILHFFIVFFFCTFINLGGLISWIFVWLMKGSSPGKKLFKLKIVKENGESLNFKDIFVREFLMKGLCSIITSGLFSFISLFMGYCRKDRKTLQDFAVETQVVSLKQYQDNFTS